MGLKVWLPLNGNLENQGLSNLKFSLVSGNIGINSSGKIGSCYSKTEHSGNGGIVSDATIDLGQSVSMFCWVKFDNFEYADSNLIGLFGQHRHNAKRGLGLTVYCESTTTGIIALTIGDGTNRSWNTYRGTTLLVPNVWYHLGFTYNNSNITFYVNGNIDGTATCTNLNVSDYIQLFGWSFSSSDTTQTMYTSKYMLKGSLNDVRIYDNCLSAKEVRDLARGLIVHYPLCTRESVLSKYSSVNWNQLIPNGDFSNGTSNWSIHDSTIETISVSNGELTLTKVGGNFGGMCRVNPFTADTTHVYYLKATLKSNSDGIGAFFGFCTSSWTVGSNTQYNTTSLNYETISFTARPAANSAYLILRTGAGASSAGVSLTCKNFMCIDLTQMFGSGNEPSKEMCDLIFVDNYYIYDTGTTKSLVSPIYDESGYGRNATVANSYLSLSNDSGRYDYSTADNGSTYMYATSPTSEARSASFWIKWPSVVQDKMIGFVDYKSKLAFGLAASGVICSSRTSSSTVTTPYFPKTMFTAGNWYHVVVVNDGSSADSTTRKLYVNGDEISPPSSTNYWTWDTNRLEICGRSSNLTSYPPLNGLISDFRLYAAALTDEDVLDLYENSATVDNFGSLHCYETKETAENLFTFENLQEDASGTISITTANDEPAIAVPGNAFQGSSHRFFEGRFQPNTQYKFDIWLDCYGASMGMGISVHYTDNTTSGQALIDFSINTRGFKHKVYYSDPSKSILYLMPYNSISDPAYYRTDSVIIPMNNPTNIERTGVVDTGCFREDTTEVSIGKGDVINVNNLIEK